jgi:hypothetical protein
MLRTVLATLLFSLAACYASTVTMFFTALPATNQDGTYNGFSTAIVNGTPAQMLMCDDYDGTTYMPSSSNMIYDYSTLTGSNPLQYVMFNKGLYDEAAVLVYELAETVNASATTIADYQYAVWNLMNPNVSLVSGRITQEQALQTTALNMVNNSVDAQFLTGTVYAYTEIYTPTSAYAGNQEFIEYAAPEPSMFWPLSLLAVMAGMGVKVQRKPQRFKL